MTATELKVRIMSDIIAPALEKHVITGKANELGYGPSLNPDEESCLYNAISADLFAKIKAFMESPEASQTYIDIRLYDPRASFCVEVREKLEAQMRAIFTINKAPAPTTSSSRWSFLSSLKVF